MSFIPNRGMCRATSPPARSVSYPIIHAGPELKDEWPITADTLPDGSWLLKDVEALPGYLGKSLSQDELDYLIAEVLDLFEDAAYGGLSFGHDVVDSQSQPGIVELRLREPYELGAENYRVRVYVIELDFPEFFGIVSLLLHVKQDGNRALNDRQNYFMALAMERCEIWVELFA
ncbi:MAG: hypothetical protein GX483_03000 [Actinomycetaceae bacterium]|nr:hypothetical protein [Actinomycetaceae bacterium]